MSINHTKFGVDWSIHIVRSLLSSADIGEMHFDWPAAKSTFVDRCPIELGLSQYVQNDVCIVFAKFGVDWSTHMMRCIFGFCQMSQSAAVAEAGRVETIRVDSVFFSPVCIAIAQIVKNSCRVLSVPFRSHAINFSKAKVFGHGVAA